MTKCYDCEGLGFLNIKETYDEWDGTQKNDPSVSDFIHNDEFENIDDAYYFVTRLEFNHNPKDYAALMGCPSCEGWGVNL